MPYISIPNNLEGPKGPYAVGRAVKSTYGHI